MSVHDLHTALEIIAAHPDEADFVGERPEELVQRAEKALGQPLPPQFRTFVRRLGAGSFCSFEIFGIITESFHTGSIPNGIWLTLKLRGEGLPDPLLIVSELGDGSLYVLDMEYLQSDSPVFIIQLDGSGVAASEAVATDFGAFLLENVRQQLDDTYRRDG